MGSCNAASESEGFASSGAGSARPCGSPDLASSLPSRAETARILRTAPQLDGESGSDFGVGEFESDIEHALGNTAATTEQLVAEVA